MTPVEVRRGLVDALKLDLVGPDNGSDLEAEVLTQAPSRWYLTGFLVPLEADPAQKSDDTAQDEFDFEGGDSDAGDDDTIPETPAARRAFFPSSIGPEPAGDRNHRTTQGDRPVGRLPGRIPECWRARG